MNLRELTEDQEAILKQVEDGDFSIDDVSDHLDMLEEDRNKKIESYLHVINNLQSKVSVKTDEIKRIEALRDVETTALERIKDWLLLSMKDGEKHDFDLFKVSRVKGRDVVSMLNEHKIPRKYFTDEVIIDPKPDKKEILKALKAGVEMDGAEIKQSKSSLRIK
jgi:hypothetical protein